MNEKLSKIVKFVIVIIFAVVAILSFIISVQNVGLAFGIILTMVVCAILLLLIALFSSMFTPTLFSDSGSKKGGQSKKGCEEGNIICLIQNKTKEAILQYLKCRDIKLAEDKLTISQVSSNEEYKKLCEQRETIRKNKIEKQANENKLEDIIRRLFVSIPEKEIWFKIRLIDQEFGICKQIVETKKFNEHGIVQDLCRYQKIYAIYIKPWNDSLSYDVYNDSYIFCEGYSCCNDNFHIANKERIDMFITEHWRK
jgi:hypothetical protein